MKKTTKRHSAGHNAEVDFRREKRGNTTHTSTTDPDALLYRKSSGTDNAVAICNRGLRHFGEFLVIGPVRLLALLIPLNAI